MNILNDSNNKLNKKQRHFFSNLSNYLNLPLYFIGSVLRYDYIPNKSDIDLEIYSDNELSTLFKLKTYLHITNDKIKLLQFECNNITIVGYKIYYDNNLEGYENIRFDLALFTLPCKQIILPLRIQHTHMPFYSQVYLLMIKYIYYYSNVIHHTVYSDLKRWNTIYYNPTKTISEVMKYDEYIQKENINSYYIVKLYK